VLHYGQAIFDGLKAFRGDDGEIRLFRADRHAQRFNRSATLMCMPELPVDIIRRSFDALVGLDADWVPRKPGTSLYLRPTIIATDVMLGVHPAHRLLYFLILSPVGSYYKEGVKPVRILASDTHVRAVKGGTGEAKTAANYAQSLAGQRDAEAAGYTQVLYLDGVHRKYLDEVGTMNIMVQIGEEVITPPLAGTILDGVTRNSALQLMRDWGLKVSERPITIDEVMEAGRNGTLKEMWGTGTAAVVSPVGTLGYKGEDVTINGGRTGELTRKLYDAITPASSTAAATTPWLEQPREGAGRDGLTPAAEFFGRWCRFFTPRMAGANLRFAWLAGRPAGRLRGLGTSQRLVPLA